MDNVSIVVHKRDVTGTRATKRLRKSGLIPGVIYGHGKDAVLIAVEPHVLREALHTSAGMHAVLDVTFEGQKRGHKAIVKELHARPGQEQRDPRRPPGDPPGRDHRDHGQPSTSRARPRASRPAACSTSRPARSPSRASSRPSPSTSCVDISELDMNETLQVSDLVVPEGIEIMADAEEVLCSVLPPRKVEVEEGVEGEEAVEGVAAAEPELVGKKEEEGEG